MTSTEMSPYVILGPPENYFANPDDYDAIAVSDEIADGSAEITATLPIDGTYIIWASSVDLCEVGAYTLDITYTEPGTAPAPQAVAPNVPPISTSTVPANPGTIAFGQTLSGRLDTTDAQKDDDSFYDSYRFTAQAGQTVRVAVSSNDFDAYVLIKSPAGNYDVSEGGGGTGNNAQADYTIPSSGEYILEANSLTGNQTGAYQVSLSLTSAPVAVAAGDTLSYGQTVQGNLQKGDQMTDGKLEDSYRFTGRAGEFSVVDMVATYDTFLRLARANAPDNQLAYDDDTGDELNARLVHRLDQAGDYIVYATTASTGTTGPYSLSLQQGAAPSTDTRPIEAGRQVKAMLVEGDPTTLDGRHFQAYRFSATQGEQITVTLRSIAFDTYLRLYSADDIHGEQLAFDDDGAGDGDSRITFTIPQSGDYVILATSYDSAGRGAFTLDFTK